MFGRIAGRYDLANRLLSGGRDVAWRRRLVAAAVAGAPRDLLDLATGSGDVAFALGRAAPAARITGADFCLPMLAEAERKKAAAGGSAHVAFQPADALALPFPAGSFDVVTIAFGLRNLADRARGLAEMRRVLRPGGRLLVLEFSQPQAWFRPFYLFYLRRILPAFAGRVTGDRAAYVYLNESIESFPGRSALAAELAAAGFQRVTARALTFGIVALHEGVAPS
jgi:demethylmenaquinone methyltransferase / 2-methoxy-6-polyprenyl-1,4-benzoquinol methylase